MGVKRVALSSQMLLPKQRTLAQLPLLLLCRPVLLVISNLAVIITLIILQTFALLVHTEWLLTLACQANTNQELNVMVS